MQKSLVSMIAVLSLVFVAACSDDSDPPRPDAPVGGNADADTTPTIDASEGPEIDAGGGTAPTAANLGQVCDPMTAGSCPEDYFCLTLAAGQPGFCSIICEGGADMFTCSDANGFPGPGLGMCILQAPVDGVNTPFCGVACGTQIPGTNGMCPTGLTCGDADGNGMTDICVP